MLEPHALVGLFWLAFVLLWLILSQFNKKASRGTSRGVAWALRAVILIAVLTVIPSRRRGIAALLTVGSRSLPLHPGIVWQWLGVGLCVLGFGLAFWARGYLGRNWGMPMSLRQGHELVTTGPYTYVRHPIYTGLILAMIGTALVVGLWWLVLFVFYFTYFIFSARTEEKMMLAQFPDAYPAYRRRTKMLLPFLF